MTYQDAEVSKSNNLQDLPLIQKVLNKDNTNSNMSSRACFSPPNRSEEFEIFKRGNGAEMNKILTENKGKITFF